MKSLIWTLILAGLPASVGAQEPALRRTTLSPDLRYEVVPWTAYGVLRLDKHTGAVDVLTGGTMVNGLRQPTSWEPTEVKRDPLEGLSTNPLFSVEPQGTAPRFQIVAFGSTRSPLLIDAVTGRLWIGAGIQKIRSDGYAYLSIDWRPAVEPVP